MFFWVIRRTTKPVPLFFLCAGSLRWLARRHDVEATSQTNEATRARELFVLLTQRSDFIALGVATVGEVNHGAQVRP